MDVTGNGLSNIVAGVTGKIVTILPKTYCKGAVQHRKWYRIKVRIFLCILGLVFVLTGCNNGTEPGDWYAYSSLNDGPTPPPDAALIDTVQSHVEGAQLVLSYDFATGAFTGTVQNTTETKLHRVRVEVHLSNGTTLGPTTPVNLAPGQVVDVTLPARIHPASLWSASLEVD